MRSIDAIEEQTANQFTWMETLLLPYLILMYLVSWAVEISIIVDKWSEGFSSAWIYLLFFITAHTAAGLKNLQHYQEGGDEQSSTNCLLNILFLLLSPLLRYYNCWVYGRRESQNREYGARFVAESVTVANLRLCETLLGDAPIALLLISEDVWEQSSLWAEAVQGSNEDSSCVSPDCDTTDHVNLRWIAARILILAAQIAQALTLLVVMSKRYRHMVNLDCNEHLESTSAKQGRVNIFGCVLLFAGYYTFLSSRLLGYSQVLTAAGLYGLLIIAIRWFVNAFWHLVTSSSACSDDSFVTRSCSSFTVGAIWLLGLTNSSGGNQLRHYIIQYILTGIETIVCSSIWFMTMKDSGNYFTTNGIWAVFLFYSASALLFGLYYLVFHPSRQICQQSTCCPVNSKDPSEDKQELDASCDARYKESYDGNYQSTITRKYPLETIV